jgi:ceramide glucosyltransferase
MLPLRDLIGFGLWITGFAGDSVVWRGERFHLKNGKLTRSPN